MHCSLRVCILMGLNTLQHACTDSDAIRCSEGTYVARGIEVSASSCAKCTSLSDMCASVPMSMRPHAVQPACINHSTRVCGKRHCRGPTGARLGPTTVVHCMMHWAVGKAMRRATRWSFRCLTLQHQGPPCSQIVVGSLGSSTPTSCLASPFLLRLCPWRCLYLSGSRLTKPTWHPLHVRDVLD
jgi:hypothetical protein